MASLNMRDIDLLLIGVTGSGRSSTGNSILRKKAFKSSAGQSSVTTDTTADWSNYNGRTIKVVDTPGVGDTRWDFDEGKKHVIDAMEKAIAMNPKGYHALLLVVPFGVRFTKDTLEFLKAVFGKDFIKKYCILVMTRGDYFVDEYEDTGMTFADCFNNLGGPFKALYDACQQRAVLFDNTSKDESKQLDQLDNLIRLIDSMWKPGHRYTYEDFNNSAEARVRVMVEAQEPKISVETMEERHKLLQEMERISLRPFEERGGLNQGLLARFDALHKALKTQDRGTGALHRLMEPVDNLKVELRNEIMFSGLMSRECARMRQEYQGEIKLLKMRIQKLE